MPFRPPKICAHAGCQARTSGRYCSDHARRREERPASSARGYGATWRRVRAAQLVREPWCRSCASEGRRVPAGHVDHIVPRARGGSDDPGNLQSLCTSCHNAKTAREDGGFGNARGPQL